MRAATLAILLLLATAVRADYVDPWGLPSGSATLSIATQELILSGEPVEAFDFTGGALMNELGYLDLVAEGVADLLFVELVVGEQEHWLRAPEDPVHVLDRLLIADVGEETLESVTDMLDDEGQPRELLAMTTASEGHAYVMLQIDAAAAIETTAVKLAVTALSDTTVTFDWAWQPNGEREFVPVSTEASSLSAIKALF